MGIYNLTAPVSKWGPANTVKGCKDLSKKRAFPTQWVIAKQAPIRKRTAADRRSIKAHHSIPENGNTTIQLPKLGELLLPAVGAYL